MTTLKALLDCITDYNEWLIFLKRSALLLGLGLAGLVLWIFPVSMFFAPFYATVSDTETKSVKVYEQQTGLSTSNAIKHRLEDLLDEGLVTNFFALRAYIDNNVNEQIGQLEIYRIAVYVLENHLARNRGSGGANKCLEQARANIYADYTLPLFTSYTTRLQDTIKKLECYNKSLIADAGKAINDRKAVFIANSDNLAEALDKTKQQLQSNLKFNKDLAFYEQDDQFFKIRGNLIALLYFLEGIEIDFKQKMLDKTLYEENFVPIITLLKSSIKILPFIIWEGKGDLSKLVSQANTIAIKMAELRDKLQNG